MIKSCQKTQTFRCFVHSYDGRCFGSFTDALPTNLTDNFYYIVLARLRKCSLCENNADSPTKPLPTRTLLFVLTSHGKGKAEAQSMNSTTVCKNQTDMVGLILKTGSTADIDSIKPVNGYQYINTNLCM